MRPVLTMAVVAASVTGTGAARAVTCSPGVGPSCVGEVLRTTQPYKFGARRPAIVKAGGPVAAGAEVCFVGQSKFGRKLFFLADRSELMFDGADVRLPTGCKLDPLDTSEPD